jgi:hypothetical protein
MSTEVGWLCPTSVSPENADAATLCVPDGKINVPSNVPVAGLSTRSWDSAPACNVTRVMLAASGAAST